MQDYRKIKTWQKAHRLALDVYLVTRNFPKAELYGITSQVRRASVSIPAIIAEGSGRRTRADFARFLTLSLGSVNEVEYFLLLSRDLKYLEESEYRSLIDQLVEIRKMLVSFTATIQESDNR
ncbi:MAG: four helix bundle protein [Bacteroidota bacterium]